MRVQWWKEELNWPSFFPIRTVVPLRVAIAEPKVINPCLGSAFLPSPTHVTCVA